MKTNLLYRILKIIAILIIIFFIFLICKYQNEIAEFFKNVFLKIFDI